MMGVALSKTIRLRIAFSKKAHNFYEPYKKTMFTFFWEPCWHVV
jgi:hypothetical protein